jgi:P4 family phage/plasmid primase-like protien
LSFSEIYRVKEKMYSLNYRMSNQQEKKLNTFLSKLYRTRNIITGIVGEYTHTRMPSKYTSGGAFNIPDDKLDEFYELYSIALASGSNLSILEANSTISPLLIDLDFRHKIEQSNEKYAKSHKRLINEKHINSFVLMIMKCIDNWFDINSTRSWSKELRRNPPDGFSGTIPKRVYDPRIALVFRRKRPYSDNNKILKDGVHIIFPELITNTLSRHILRGNVILNMETTENKDLQEMVSLCNNKMEDIYDKAVIDRNPWMVYGSDKPGKYDNSYELISVIKIGCKKNDYSITNICPKKYIKVRANKVRNDFDHLTEAELDILGMAVHLRTRRCLKKRQVAYLRMGYETDKLIVPIINRKFVPLESYSGINSEDKPLTPFKDIDYAAGLVLNCLSEERATKYDDWMRVGRALCNISGDDDILKKAWITWSKRPEIYIYSAEKSCEELWSYFKRTKGNSLRTLRITSLEESARLDNQIEFERLQSIHMQQLLVTSLKTRDYDVARIICNLDGIPLRYKCIDRSKNIWYVYNEKNGLWTCQKGNNPLDLLLPTRIYKMMKKKVLDIFNHECATSEGDGDKLTAANKVREKGFHKLDPLMSNSKMNAVGSVVSRLLFDKDFPTLLDQNLDLVGLGGGNVYDLNLGKLRKMKPTDHISLSTNIPFYPETETFEEQTNDPNSMYHMYHPDVVGVLNFISSLFKDNRNNGTQLVSDVGHYVLKYLASMYDGHTKDELFHVLIGTGANGKSKIQELVKLMLGDYFASVTIKLFTGKRADAHSTTSAYECIRNKRSVWVQEPEKGERINSGVLKELTGGDSVYSRALFQEGSEFKPQAKFALVANHKPDVNADDKALWRRLRCIRFPYEFTPNPDPTRPNEKQRDDNLSSNFNKWKGGLQWVLLTHYYPLYKKEGILSDKQIPRAIYEETTQYRKSNDEIEEFISNNMIYVGEDFYNEDNLIEVNIRMLCSLFSRFVERKRPRSSHIRIANNQEKIKKLFEKRKKFGTCVELPNGDNGWNTWVWKQTFETSFLA